MSTLAEASAKLDLLRRNDIATKVAEIMGEVEKIEKRGRFTVDNKLRYKFVQATDAYEALRAKFAERGIAFKGEYRGIESEHRDGKLHVVTIRVAFSLTDGETGTVFGGDWAGSGQDTGDKAISKAFTGAAKSWLLTTFLVPSDTDPDDPASGGAGRQLPGKLNKKDAETLTKLVKAYLDGGDETVVRLRLKQLGAGDVTDIAAAAVKLSKDKATQLFEWLDAELVARQGAKA